MGPGGSRSRSLGAGRVTPDARVERPPRVAVIGAAQASESEYSDAQALGHALAKLGAVVVCGGYGGVMEAAARGAAEAGGLTIGILRGSRGEDANPWIQVPLPTGLGEARNALVVAGAEAAVAVGGSWGTLSEIALAKKMGLDVGTLGLPPAGDLDLPALQDPSAAAHWALERAAAFRAAG